jgi:hypothetical protein
MIFPLDLPEKYNIYFNQFEYCVYCENFSSTRINRNGAFLVQILHNQEWHFRALFSEKSAAENYLLDNISKKMRIVDLLLPHNKSSFFDEIRQERSDQIIQEENKQSIDSGSSLEDKFQILSSEMKFLFKAIVASNVLLACIVLLQ